MKPATRGCTETVVTGSSRPENSSKSRSGLETTSATETVGGGGAAAAALALLCEQPVSRAMEIAALNSSRIAARLRNTRVFMMRSLNHV